MNKRPKTSDVILAMLAGIVVIPLIVIGSVFFGCWLAWLGGHAFDWFAPWFGLV
jgi:hypothetical protein